MSAVLLFILITYLKTTVLELCRIRNVQLDISSLTPQGLYVHCDLFLSDEPL